MTMYAEGPQLDSVQIAVKREAQRRKRLLMSYLLLLLVPIAIGAYAIWHAPTQTEAVAKEVIPIVHDQVQETIKPQVEKEVAAQAEPIIRQKLDKELDSAVALRVKPIDERAARLERSVTMMRVGDPRVQELEKRVAELEQQVARLNKILQVTRPIPQ